MWRIRAVRAILQRSHVPLHEAVAFRKTVLGDVGVIVGVEVAGNGGAVGDIHGRVVGEDADNGFTVGADMFAQ